MLLLPDPPHCFRLRRYGRRNFRPKSFSTEIVYASRIPPRQTGQRRQGKAKPRATMHAKNTEDHAALAANKAFSERRNGWARECFSGQHPPALFPKSASPYCEGVLRGLWSHVQVFLGPGHSGSALFRNVSSWSNECSTAFAEREG